METFLKEQQFREIFESHIKIETYSKSIENLFSDRSRRKIDYKPYYQRNYVWDDAKASYFIESIFLGTEIPPLVFFEEDRVTEVIDGRQRFETIKRFLDSDFSLSKNGLTSLSELAKKSISQVREDHQAIYDAFLDAKVRIIGFKLVNNPPSDPVLIDKIKKEIFGRYNSGITPLRRAEIDNAIYDSNELTKFFKSRLKKSKDEQDLIINIFLRQPESVSEFNIESILQFIRKSLVLFKFPIKTYASGKSRIELIRKFYDFSFGHECDPHEIYTDFFHRVNIVKALRENMVSLGQQPNRLFCECLLWATYVISEEGKNIQDFLSDVSLSELKKLWEEHADVFDLTDSHYGRETTVRFTTVAVYLEKVFSVSLAPYLQTDKSARELLGSVTQGGRNFREEIEKLETLRVTKPDPSRNTIEDIVRAMGRTRFLVRPSYQRSEVINLAKSSAIIESMLLGIMLPAIFIYKRLDGVSEVIDGQQRLLTILGFIGKEYVDDQGKICKSKNHQFRLKDLRILKDISRKTFEEMGENLQDRILEFDLFVVEIEERLNPQFNPVDLFIRLNDKPFPIREHSFEMWNSWADKEVIDSIKTTVEMNKKWFYIKKIDNEKSRDRMSNEELYTILAYFMHRKAKGDETNIFLDVYQKGPRINARIKSKSSISNVLVSASQDELYKSDFMKSVNSLVVFINKVKILLNGQSESLLSDNLDALMSSGAKRKYFSRTLQDFYILWRVIDGIEISFSNREKIYSELVKIYSYMRNIPAQHLSNNGGYTEFEKLLNIGKS